MSSFIHYLTSAVVEMTTVTIITVPMTTAKHMIMEHMKATQATHMIQNRCTLI